MYINELKNHPVEGLDFLTKRQVSLLKKMDISNAYDILNNYPYRYDDRSSIESIQAGLLKGAPAVILATVVAHEYIYFKGRRHPKIIIQDQTMRASLVGFNREYLKQSLKIGQKYWIYATFGYKYNEVQSSTFDFEIFRDDASPKNFGFILPVYKLTEELYLKELRTIVKKALARYIDSINDEIPDYILKAHNLKSKKEALLNIHYPPDAGELKKAKLRLAYEEFLSIELAVMMKRNNSMLISKTFSYPQRSKTGMFLKSLPYSLTNAQDKALREIIKDMERAAPMHRLLQGDVGCGKTTVALAGLIHAAENGRQGALMVPTEVLAIQHYNTAKGYLETLGIKPVLLTGSLPARDKLAAYEDIKSGKASIIIGTQALIQEDLEYRNLSFIVFDEQHRFGVLQRISLSKKTTNPDILVMTATPIPRTLALTVYGDLDLTVIDEMPAGRKKVRTQWLTKKEYKQLLDLVEDELGKGRQAYFIYPLIEESEKIDTDNAIKMHRVLSGHFSDYKVGLLHGRMSPMEKYETMEKFRAGKLQILVSTTVIEVGIDVKNATVMAIEGAERFGLSQLHQLRGRVGRDKYESYCVLVTASNESEETKARMSAMVNHSDGFRIAEEDLKLRGPGEILGVRQSGLPELRIADFVKNSKLLILAGEDSKNILAADPGLTEEANRQLREGIIAFLPADYLYAG